jgi:hypothetical protein
VVTVGSLLELHKTSPLMLGTLHHMGVLDFVVRDTLICIKPFTNHDRISCMESTKMFG